MDITYYFIEYIIGLYEKIENESRLFLDTYNGV